MRVAPSIIYTIFVGLREWFSDKRQTIFAQKRAPGRLPRLATQLFCNNGKTIATKVRKFSNYFFQKVKENRMAQIHPVSQVSQLGVYFFTKQSGATAIKIAAPSVVVSCQAPSAPVFSIVPTGLTPPYNPYNGGK